MTTSLQQQLAGIAANSTHQLDLKAQKARHSKSLLFEPRVAAAQTFDTIWQICYEGFEELCMLDPRFARFARNLFSDQSKSEDRTQMTAQENEELDQVVESFLGLVCGRLLLKPAMKAVEWLVRRFRVQEYNTECMLLTFLPYHTAHIFPTLLSIIPEQLPATFRFLHPYVSSLQTPPRHAILSAAVTNQGFFSAFSQYVLRVSKARHHSAVLLGFWASVTAQAVNGMIDASRTGRDAVRKQREEDLLLRLLPVLQSALKVKGVPELYLGACMITTVLATKASLEDRVLSAMMEAVAGSWTEQTLEDGLRCMAVIAEEKQEPTQPASITRTLLASEDLMTRLLQLGNSQRVSKLALGTAIGLADQARNSANVAHMPILQAVLDLHSLPDGHRTVLLERLLIDLSELKKADPAADASRALSSVLSGVCEHADHAQLLEAASKNTQIELSSLNLQVAQPAMLTPAKEETNDIDMSDEDDENDTGSVSFESLKATLPNLPDRPVSFLQANMGDDFEQYLRAFQTSLASKKSTGQFLDLPQFHCGQSSKRPELLSFLARSLSSNTTATTKSAALEASTRQIERERASNGMHLQTLIPYAITALGDASQKVRRSAASLCLAMAHQQNDESEKKAQSKMELEIYGTPISHTLFNEDFRKFVETAIVPILEDCIIDAGYISQALADTLSNGTPGNPSQINNSVQKELKKSLRVKACDYLAAHAASTPVLPVERQLLLILHGAGNSAHHARINIILPLVQRWLGQSSEEAAVKCSQEKVDLQEMDKAIVSSLTHRNTEEIQALKDIAAGRYEHAQRLLPLAFDRLRQIWSSLKSSQKATIDFLLELLFLGPEAEENQVQQDLASETLRNLHLPADVLVHIVEALPNAAELSDQPPPSKKRRTSANGDSKSRSADPAKLQSALRRVTLVLELVEGSKPEKHPQLLKGLFHMLGELHHYKTLAGSELVYLQVLLLGSLRSVVEGLKSSSSPETNRSVVRTDLIVECVRTTSSTQVHNTALLLVASLARWAPELVLHSVMPLFTFMSSTMLRASDDYTAHVTDQTVAHIIPPLAASLKKSGKNLASGVSDLLLSFVTAFEHIPLHRRLGLFEHLVQTVGPEETLFAVLAMVIERYPDDSRTPQFTANLTNKFPAVTALVSAKQYLGLVSDALKPKRGLSETLLGLSEKGPDLVRDSIDQLLDGLSTLLSNVQLRKRLALQLSEESGSEVRIRSVYASVLENAMLLNRELASDKLLSDSADAVLRAVLGLMPTKDFIDSSSQLMQTGSDRTRQQVFKSLETRATQAKRSDAESRQVFIDVLPNCGVFLQEDQPVATRHAAISCMDQISEKYGKTDRVAVFAAAELVAGRAALDSNGESLRIISTLCLASMIEVLGDDCVPILPKSLTTILGYVEQTLHSETPSVQLVDAGFGFFNAVLDHLPWLLSSKYLDSAMKQAAHSAANEHAELVKNAAVASFCGLVAKNVGAPELFTSLRRTWADAKQTGAGGIQLYLIVLRGSINTHTKATITKNAQVLFSVMLEAFDLRKELAQNDPEEDHSSLFSTVDAIALEMTLKLNDATFRPFYIRLVEWATQPSPKDPDTRILRLSSLYSFSLALFSQLKSIVTGYTSYLLDNASALLQTPPTPSPHTPTLTTLLLRTLVTSFQHDPDDFWQTPAHFTPIAEPLVSALRTIPTHADLIATIADLAAAAHAPDHHKTLNSALMALMRAPDARVRLAAVRAERAVTQRVKFDWLALLPEMLPVISELQEDEDEGVERETLRWVAEIEGVTGESLGGMLA